MSPPRRPARAETAANNRKLEDDEEQKLNEWVLDLAARGYPPRKRRVEETANLLRQLRGMGCFRKTSPTP